MSSSSSNATLRDNAQPSPTDQTNPQLIYSVIARERVILVEYGPYSGNFPTVTRLILDKIPSVPGQRKSYTYDSYVFHYITSNGLTYVCLADRACGQTVPFRFLDDVIGRFEPRFLTTARTAFSFQLNSDFQATLKSAMARVNEGTDSSMNRIQSHLQEISGNMVEGIEKILVRQEKIELLVEKTDALSQNAMAFRRQAGNIRRTLWWRDVRLKVTIGVVGATIIFLLIMFLCGGVHFDKCRSD
jgi:vesicle-associated membrane protein 7